jgi:hypothetical protein
MLTVIPSRASFWRRGNALIATLIISATVGLALNLSSDRLYSLNQQANMDHAKLQARLAAESVAALVEGRLKLNASDTRVLTKPLVESSPGWVWGFPGHSGSTSATTPGLRVGDCLVWWRIEPVKVWSSTIEEGTTDPAGAKFALNPNTDDQNVANETKYASLVLQSDFLSANDRNFIFRIVTEAYYLKDPSSTTATPRTNARDRVCSAQASRVVQYTLVNLFEYAIFYAATGPTGDLEMWQGTGMSVKGRVHSNGAIYIGGGGQSYIAGQYHTAASGNGGLSIGGAGLAATTVTAVDGIYRMRKPGNFIAAMRGVASSSYSPKLIPTTGLGGEGNFNGDTPTDNRHTINATAFTSANDSRTPNLLSTDFKKRVRDQWSGATVVSSLANVPKFAGRPFEAEVLGDATQLLYADSTQPVPSAGGGAFVSIDRNHAAFAGNGAPFYYTQDPMVATGPIPLTFNPAASFNPVNPTQAAVTALNMTMYWQTADRESRDVNPAPAAVGLVNDPMDTAGGFQTWTRTDLLNNQLIINKDTCGLVIRERPLVVNGVTTTFPPYPFPMVTGLPDSPTPAELASLATYLAAQYQVCFYGQDITNVFFGDLVNAAPPAGLAPCTTRAQAIVTEEFIVNRREANFMSMFFGQNQNTYRVNLVTIGLRRVQEFLAFTPMQNLSPAFAGRTEMAKAHFNGVVYVHRTRRSQTHHPIDRPWWHFNTVAQPSLNPPPQKALPALAASYPSGVREQDGPVEIFHAGVRIRGGLVADGANRAWMASVNWQHDSTGDGVPDSAPLGTSKTTFITPNPVYLWGDFNTTTYSDGAKEQRTPCAIFADSINLLSAAWMDANVPAYASGVPAATHTSYVTSFVMNNIPCQPWNAVAEGSGAVANVCRFLENWGGGANPGGLWPLGLPDGANIRPPTYGGQVVYTFMGSLVVMNQQRYSRGALGAGTTNLNNTSFYSPPFRNLAYNTDLKLAAGQPPESLNALDTTRVVSLVNTFDN